MMAAAAAARRAPGSESPEERRRRFETDALPHMNALYGFALRLTRNPGDAQDLTQDALLRAYRFFDHWEPDTNLRAWLFTITRNAFINRYRREAGAPDTVDFGKIEETYESLIDGALRGARRTPEQVLLDGALDGEISGALDRLPEEYREVVWLAVVEDLSYKEVARVLDIPIGTVMSRLHRGRRLLQSWLMEYGRKRGLLARRPEELPAGPAAEREGAGPAQPGGEP